MKTHIFYSNLKINRLKYFVFKLVKTQFITKLIQYPITTTQYFNQTICKASCEDDLMAVWTQSIFDNAD